MPSELSSDFDINLNRFENGFDTDNNDDTLNPVLDVDAENEKILPLNSFQNVEKPVLQPENDVPDVPCVVPDSNVLPQQDEDEEQVARRLLQRAIGVKGGPRTYQPGPNYSLKRIRYNAARKPGGDAKPEEPGGDAEQEDHAEHAVRGQDGGKLKAPRGNTLKEDKNWAPPNPIAEVEPTTRRLRSQSQVIPNYPLPLTYLPESPPACQPYSEPLDDKNSSLLPGSPTIPPSPGLLVSEKTNAALDLSDPNIVT